MFDKLLSNPIHKYIAIAIFLLISVYVTGQCLNYQNYVIEGLANNNRNLVDKDHYAQLDQELKNVNEHKKDTLLVSKYKSQFEDLLIGLNENTNLQLLENMNEYANSLIQKNDKKCKKCLDNIKNLHSMNSSLNSVMKFLDNK
jgi:hypothetical protein